MGPAPNFHHVHRAQLLPKPKRTDGQIIRRGYAVGMGGDIPQTWVFFLHLEPAIVFGRAGRMSGFDIRGYGVYEAAREDCFDPGQRKDITTLYVGRDVKGRAEDGWGYREDEQAIFERWAKGCDPESAYYAL